VEIKAAESKHGSLGQKNIKDGKKREITLTDGL
jgi:hypothetical protein